MRYENGYHSSSQPFLGEKRKRLQSPPIGPGWKAKHDVQHAIGIQVRAPRLWKVILHKYTPPAIHNVIERYTRIFFTRIFGRYIEFVGENNWFCYIPKKHKPGFIEIRTLLGFLPRLPLEYMANARLVFQTNNSNKYTGNTTLFLMFSGLIRYVYVSQLRQILKF